MTTGPCKSFGELFCERYTVPAEEFAATLLRRTCHRRGRFLLAPVMACLPKTLNEDLALLDRLKGISDPNEFSNAINDIRKHNLYGISKWRRSLGLRVSVASLNHYATLLH